MRIPLVAALLFVLSGCSTKIEPEPVKVAPAPVAVASTSTPVVPSANVPAPPETITSSEKMMAERFSAAEIRYIDNTMSVIKRFLVEEKRPWRNHADIVEIGAAIEQIFFDYHRVPAPPSFAGISAMIREGIAEERLAFRYLEAGSKMNDPQVMKQATEHHVNAGEILRRALTQLANRLEAAAKS